ncbi:MAG: acylphosphatase [Geobacter sp.]|nr:MAG: acylphosphatase [Geobacter sp.]
MKIRTMVIVKGLVQRVNFRRFTQQNAIRLQVTGWVQNLPDGSVEGCFEGEEAKVLALVDWCRTGPSASRVDAVVTERDTYTGEFDDFAIRR